MVIKVLHKILMLGTSKRKKKMFYEVDRKEGKNEKEESKGKRKTKPERNRTLAAAISVIHSLS